ILSVVVLFAGVVFIYWAEINMYLSKNKSESDTDLDTHVQSIYNVTTDDSNTERINRWAAALRMFQEKPITGWGPNTYQHKYAPFQISWQKTKISTNMGNLGNAHSEFIGPLAEMGLPGMLLVMLLVVVALNRAMKLFYNGTTLLTKYAGLFITLSLVTYYVHGLLNNYLDVDKANVAIWTAMGSIVALDVFHNKEQNSEVESSS
ncbi:MAG: O-antigen ligase family protein, partial [Bacteroidetes bacterium]|nr:O-antigen ligase family protein [Bacteroidota bacterium]